MMTNNSPQSNRIDEELVCMECFASYLRRVHHHENIDIRREYDDPPDFWMTIEGNKFAVEVTSIVNDEAYHSRCRKLAKTMQQQSEQSDELSGTYALTVMSNPEIPKTTSENWKALLEKARYYMFDTKLLPSAKESLLYEDAKGSMSIVKLMAQGSVVGLRLASAKWEGEVRDELRLMFQKAINRKRTTLERKAVPSLCDNIVLLLYDAYGYAAIEDAWKSFKEVSGYEWLHSVFWVAAFKEIANQSSPDDTKREGWFLYSKDETWSKNLKNLQ